MKKSICIAGCAFSILAAATNCPALDGDSESSTTTMKKIVVTATKTESPSGQIGGSSVTVISSEEIEAKQQTTVEEVLKGVPGLDIVANGGAGTKTSVFLRGADSKNTLILVDGIMVNDTSGTNRDANLANLTVDNIERIEIVRGPMSVLYGSNATAGVVNIITKKGEGKANFTFGGEGGSYGTWKTYGGANGSGKKFNYALNISRTETQGFSTANDDNPQIPHTGGSTSENDSWENTTLSGKFGIDLTPDFDVSAIVRSIDSKVSMDSSVNGYLQDNGSGGPIDKYTASDQQFAKLNIHNKLFAGKLDSNIYYQLGDNDREIVDDYGVTLYSGESDEIGWQGAFNGLKNHTITLGFSYFEESMDSSGGFAKITDKSADDTSCWIQDQLYLGDSFDVVAGVRVDDHDRFGSEATYRVSPAYAIQQTDTTLKANFGTGFRAPSLFELFAPGFGNPNLEAEKSKGWDVGLEQKLLGQQVTVGMTYFHMVFDNLIEYKYISSQYEQATGDTITSGVESFIRYTPTNNLDLTLNYTYTDTENPDGERLARRPLNKASLNTRYSFSQKGLLNLDVIWVDERDASSHAFDEGGNPVSVLESYTVVNLALNYKMTDHVEIYGRIDNLFDEKYEEAWSYATPGLSGYAGLKMTY